MKQAVLDAIAVVAPTSCAGCNAADRALCSSCRRALHPRPKTIDLAQLRLCASLEYGDVVRSVLLAFKDGGRTDQAAPLADAMRAAISGSLLGLCTGENIELATIPSTRVAFRKRGFHPVERILSRCALRASRPLKILRQTQDQSELGAAARSQNRKGSLIARGNLAGRRFLLVDDIVTTGATLGEARRAIEAAGGVVTGASSVAYTPRRRAQT